MEMLWNDWLNEKAKAKQHLFGIPENRSPDSQNRLNQQAIKAPPPFARFNSQFTKESRITVVPPNYRTTDPHRGLPPSHLFGSQSGPAAPVVGAYNDGLFMVVDETSSKTLLTSWSWLIGNDALALMTTGFGDAFFWKPDEGVSFLGVQRAAVEFVDAEIDRFITDFLVQPQVIDQVLRQDYLKQLVRLQRPLNYGEVFILEPWLMLGGKDASGNYGIGKCSVYLNLVAQAHREGR